MKILELEVKMSGKAESNIALYQKSVLSQIEQIKSKKLETDEDFSSAEKVVKICKEQEKALVDAKQTAQDKSASIKEVFAAIDNAQNIFRDTRLELERQIKTEKVNRKQAIIDQAVKDYETFIQVTLKRYGFDKLPTSDCTEKFAAATKGKKNIKSMQAAVDQSLETTKANLNVFASQKFSNLQIIKARKEQILFPDPDQLSNLAPDLLMIEIEKREIAHEENLEKIRLEEERKAKAKYNAGVARHEILKDINVDLDIETCSGMEESVWVEFFEGKNSEYQSEQNKKYIEKKKKETPEEIEIVEGGQHLQDPGSPPPENHKEQSSYIPQQNYHGGSGETGGFRRPSQPIDSKESEPQEQPFPDIQHQGEIMSAIKVSLMKFVDEPTAKKIVLAMVNGKIANVTINF